MPMEVQRWLASLVEALFPGKCLGCGRLFHRETINSAETADPTTTLAPYFCPHCRRQYTAVTSPLCTRCGVVFGSREGADHLCGHCLQTPGAFTRARATGIYDQSLRSAIQALKFNAMVQLAAPLGGLLWQTFRQYWHPGDIDLIAPVPLHWERFRRRGFNQSYLLIAGWQLSGEAVIVRDLLVRHRATTPQTGLDRRQRQINIRRAFSVRRPGQSAGRRVLLVDDVLTTGATADACARALINDGARRVDVLTLARAV
jgi:ComF family protein